MADDKERLHKAISMLSSVQQRRIQMYYFADMTYEEIAEAEQCSFQAVEKTLRKARKTIMNILKMFPWVGWNLLFLWGSKWRHMKYLPHTDSVTVWSRTACRCSLTTEYSSQNNNLSWNSRPDGYAMTCHAASEPYPLRKSRTATGWPRQQEKRDSPPATVRASQVPYRNC